MERLYELYNKEEILNVIEIMLGRDLLVECTFSTTVQHSGMHIAAGYTETKSMTFRSHRAPSDEQKFWVVARSEKRS